MVEAVVKLPVIMEAGVLQTGIVEAMEFYILTYRGWSYAFCHNGGWIFTHCIAVAGITLTLLLELELLLG